MYQKYKELFKEYRLIVNEIDELVNQLTSIHSNYLQCKKGCDLCCMDYKIFPVEYYSILGKLRDNTISIDTNVTDDNSCAFLKDHSCIIYEHRPIICRTHGMPLIYMNDDNEWELSNCELNFKEFNFEEFTFDNTFPQDKFNSRLFMLNKEFISGFEKENYKETDLIPIKTLAKQFQ